MIIIVIVMKLNFIIMIMLRITIRLVTTGGRPWKQLASMMTQMVAMPTTCRAPGHRNSN